MAARETSIQYYWYVKKDGVVVAGIRLKFFKSCLAIKRRNEFI